MSLRAKKALGTLGRTFRKAISTPDPTYEDVFTFFFLVDKTNKN